MASQVLAVKGNPSTHILPLTDTQTSAHRHTQARVNNNTSSPTHRKTFTQNVTRKLHYEHVYTSRQEPYVHVHILAQTHRHTLIQTGSRKQTLTHPQHLMGMFVYIQTHRTKTHLYDLQLR